MPRYASKPDLLFAMFGLVGISTIVLPFYENVSPLIVIGEWYHDLVPGPGLFSLAFYAPVAAPFFLSILISIASLRVGVVGRLSKFEAGCAWVAAPLATAGTLWFAIRFLWFAQEAVRRGDLPKLVRDWADLVLLTLAPVAIVVGIVMIARAAKRRTIPHPLLAVTAMQWTYIANAAFLEAVWPGWRGWLGGYQIGAYLTLATVLVYGAHIATALWHASGHRAKIAVGEVPSTTGGPR